MIDGNLEIWKMESSHENDGFQIHIGPALGLMCSKVHAFQFHGILRTAGSGTQGKQDC